MFAELFNLVPDAMIVVDAEGRITSANTQAEHLFDVPAGGLNGMFVEELMPSELRSLHRGHRKEYMENPRIRPMGATGQSLTGQRSDGSRFPVDVALSPVWIEGKVRYLASIRDVSETQWARQALLRGRYDKLVARIGQLALAAPNETSLVERLPGELQSALSVDAVALVDAPSDGASVSVRASCGLEDALHFEAAWSVEAGNPFGRVTSTGEPVVIDDFQHAVDPRPLPQLIDAGFRSSVLVPLFDRNRPMGALVALAREPRSFDHDTVHCLQSIANVLAALIQRCRTEEQLVHAQRLDAIGQLTGGVAHDFNNMLTVVSGNLQLLELGEGIPAPSRELIESALRAVGQGADLTAKLLAFSRRQHLNPRWIEPCAAMRELGKLLARTLGESIQIEIDCVDSPPILVDAGQLDAALINLALNARDAMPRGGNLRLGVAPREIDEAAAQPDLAPGRYVVFSVGDTGLGMRPEVAARAFEPFFTTKGMGKGNGLGLSMVYGFAQQSGGAVRIESRLGYGTRVSLFLPQTAAAAPDGEVVAAPTRRGLGQRILVVEDDARVRAVAVGFLRSLGYQVREAADAVAAMQVLGSDPGIDLMFSDVALGAESSGPELAQAARRLRPHLPVVLTSANEQTLGDVAGRPFPFLRKPYLREALAAIVEQALSGSA